MLIKQLKIYYLIFLGIAAGFSACREAAKPMAFGNVCRTENLALVEMEGYLRLPNASPQENQTDSGDGEDYQLLFVENQNGTGGFLRVLIGNDKSPKPNQMLELPASYTYRDFRVFTDQGAEISADDRVKVTGKVVKESNLCVLKVEKSKRLKNQKRGNIYEKLNDLNCDQPFFSGLRRRKRKFRQFDNRRQKHQYRNAESRQNRRTAADNL